MKFEVVIDQPTNQLTKQPTNNENPVARLTTAFFICMFDQIFIYLVQEVGGEKKSGYALFK
jgi:hypothetical protein